MSGAYLVRQVRELSAENVRLTGCIVDLHRRNLELERRLEHARETIARLSAQQSTAYVPEQTIDLEVERRR